MWLAVAIAATGFDLLAASGPSVKESASVMLDLWTVQTLSASHEDEMEGRSSTVMESLGCGLDATTPKGIVLIFR